MSEIIRNILMNCGIEKNKIESSDYNSEDIMDSITVAELIIEIEDYFQIEIDGEDIIPENFKNLSAIEKLVHKYI